MSEKEKIRKFVEKFFENLGCSISYENKFEKPEESVLKIENVPKRFAKFYGKEEPYYFYFDDSQNVPEGEYVTKGSYILSCVNKFLENKGETTLLKMKFEDEFQYLYRFRLDMIIQGLTVGILLIFLYKYITNAFFDFEVYDKLPLVIFGFIALRKIKAMKKHNPITYEISFMGSHVIGYLLGALIFL